jgi:hypothetical protein
MEDKDIFKCIEIINETNLEYKKNNKIDYTKDINIKKLLKDKELFFKISKEEADKILNDLDIKKIDEVYEKLMIKN